MDRRSITQTLTGLALAASFTLGTSPGMAEPKYTLGSTTMADYISLSESGRPYFLFGALNTLLPPQIDCQHSFNVKAIGDGLLGRYHTGRLKPGENFTNAVSPCSPSTAAAASNRARRRGCPHEAPRHDSCHPDDRFAARAHDPYLGLCHDRC